MWVGMVRGGHSSGGPADLETLRKETRLKILEDPMARAIEGGGCASASTWKGKTGGESEGRQVQSDSRARANGHGAEKENRHLYPPVSEKQEMQLKEARKTKWREP